MPHLNVVDDNGNAFEWDIDLDGYWEHLRLGRPYIEKYQNAKTYFETLRALKGLYLEWLIPANKYQRCCDLPFEIDPLRLLNTAERMVNSDLYYFAMHMYPQYPILNYFVDFADPYRRVAIEVDGAKFHQDGEKELRRHKEIEADGWTLYHITGAEAFGNIDSFYALGNRIILDKDGDEVSYEYEDDFINHRDNLLISCASGIVCCIKRKHYPEKSNLEVFYLPKGDVDYLIAEIRLRFVERCNELIDKAHDARKNPTL